MNFCTRITTLFAIGLIYAAPHSAWAASATAVQVTPMFFGRWIVTDNTVERNVTVNPNGVVSSPPELIELAAPTVGVFDVSGLPDGTITDLTATQLTPMTGGGGGETWILEDLLVEPDSTTVAGGTARVNVGGTASTSGNSSMYADDEYEGEITLNFEIEP